MSVVSLAALAVCGLQLAIINSNPHRASGRLASRHLTVPPGADSLHWWSMHDPTLLEAIRIPGRPLRLVRQDLGYRLLNEEEQGPSSLIFVPPCLPENLGDPSFRTDHRLRFAYLAGAMANGIGSADIVENMARAGMLGFFGAAGLSPAVVESNIDRLQRSSAISPTDSI